MKGFAKIFEVIIASIILLTSLTFFFVPSVQKSWWDDVSVQLLAQDALEATYLNGSLTRYVKDDDTTPLNNIFSSMLPRTVDFSIEVKGIPSKVIYVSCVDCSQAQIDDISAILVPKDFMYKGRNISIRVENLSLSSGSVPEDTNIIFFFDKTKIPTYQAQINLFLSKGGGIFLLSNLVQGDLNGPIGRIFNLTWSGSTSLPPRFSDVYNSSKISHFVAKYYANISGRHLQNVENEGFSTFNSNGIRAGDWRDVVKSDDAKTFVRGNINMSGRAAWFSDYTRSDHNSSSTKAVDNLAKATIMWVGGERFRLDTIKKAPAPVHFKSSIFVHDEDSYTVDLTIWRVFF